MSDARSPSELADAYTRRRPVYENLASRFAALLTDLLRSHNLDVVDISHRVKTVESFERKIRLKGDEYDDALTEITDFAGIRVITYLIEDVERVAEIIRDQFTIDEERSGNKARELGDDQFGYLSDHYIVTVSDARSPFPEWRQFIGLKAEIQVRTVVQHAWASVEHKLRYKADQKIPVHISRQLNALSAQFENADTQFAQAQQAITDLKDDYREAVGRGEQGLRLDIASLEAYLEQSATARRALEVAASAGWNVEEEAAEGDAELRARDLRDLLRSLEATGIETVGDLDALLRRAPDVAEPLAIVAEIEAADTSGHGHIDGEAYPEDILNVILFLITNAPAERVEAVYGGVTAEAIERAIAGVRG
jgi:putative GTP pyrophosphokinase